MWVKQKVEKLIEVLLKIQACHFVKIFMIVNAYLIDSLKVSSHLEGKEVYKKEFSVRQITCLFCLFLPSNINKYFW